MRRWPALLVLACGAGVLASPAPPPLSWADWVGDWDGKLKWSSCAIDGKAVATIPIEATDGTMAIDLTGAGDSLGPLTLVEDAAGWIGQQGDVTVHVSRSKPRAQPIGEAEGIDVAVDLDSGCKMRTSTHRQTTGIAACDRLDAWSRIEARCGRLGKPPLENAARLVRQRESWSAARGDARTKLSAQCDARATKVEAELVDVGCAPNADPAIGLRGAACHALRRSAEKLARCANMPSGISSAIEASAGQLAAAAQAASAADLPTVEAQCSALHEDIVGAAQKYGCPP